MGISTDVGVWARGYLAAVLDRSPEDHGLDKGRTQNVDWAGTTLRLSVRPGRNGAKLEVGPSLGTQVGSLLALGFLGVHWLVMGGGAIAYLVGTTRGEILDPATVGLAAVLAVLVNFIYLPLMASVLERDWSFEPHLATERLNLAGISFRARTHAVIDASNADDRLVLHTADHREVVVATGWGPETNSDRIPSDLSRLIRTYLGLAPVSEMSTRMGTR